MRNNKLSGILPTSLKNFTELTILQLARNKFVGRIPTWIGTELSKLIILNLRSNNFQGDIGHELCYLTGIQILDLRIPRCFSNFTNPSGKEVVLDDRFNFITFSDTMIMASASLVLKGREDVYSANLMLVMTIDLSCNNLSGSIPSDLMALRALVSLNLSRNQLTGSIREKIGDLKSLISFDVSLNQLSGELPLSLSSLRFLSSFNVSYNGFTGRVPTSTQLQSFNESSFFHNKRCGVPLNESCAVVVPYDDHGEEYEKDGSYGADWGMIISMVCGSLLVFGLLYVVPLIVSIKWRIAYFGLMS